jgi:hydroxyacyl-ACP dehydratase HTD2-like protein with hotdog domain
MLDPQPAAGAAREADRAAPLPDPGSDPAPPSETLAHHQCTPTSTLGYCEGSENLIHLDPDYARGFGLRAPIIAGVQTINFLVAPLYRASRPRALAFSVRFLRPVFWDDALEIHGRRDAAGGLTSTWATNEAGRVVATLDVVQPASALLEEAR